MLSMVISVFEFRQGLEMPTTTAELYGIAAEAMLERGGAASPSLLQLLQRIFFEAHVAQVHPHRTPNDALLPSVLCALAAAISVTAAAAVTGTDVATIARPDAAPVATAIATSFDQRGRSMLG